jgi:hypothetical protein
MSAEQRLLEELEAYAADIRGSDLAVSCHCVVITGHSSCHSGSETSWSFEDKDPEAIRRFIGSLEEIKAHALKALLESKHEERDDGSECENCGDWISPSSGCVCQYMPTDLNHEPQPGTGSDKYLDNLLQKSMSEWPKFSPATDHIDDWNEFFAPLVPGANPADWRIDTVRAVAYGPNGQIIVA